LHGILILLRGHADEDLIRQERERNHATAGLPLMPEDATLLERTANLMKNHAIAEELKRGVAQGSQTESNPVKP
jgi:hypothetical protein